MTVTGARKGQLFYILLTNGGESPFRVFDVKVTDEWRENTKKRLILERSSENYLGTTYIISDPIRMPYLEA